VRGTIRKWASCPGVEGGVADVKSVVKQLNELTETHVNTLEQILNKRTTCQARFAFERILKLINSDLNAMQADDEAQCWWGVRGVTSAIALSSTDGGRTFTTCDASIVTVPTQKTAAQTTTQCAGTLPWFAAICLIVVAVSTSLQFDLASEGGKQVENTEAGNEGGSHDDGGDEQEQKQAPGGEGRISANASRGGSRCPRIVWCPAGPSRWVATAGGKQYDDDDDENGDGGIHLDFATTGNLLIALLSGGLAFVGGMRTLEDTEIKLSGYHSGEAWALLYFFAALLCILQTCYAFSLASLHGIRGYAALSTPSSPSRLSHHDASMDHVAPPKSSMWQRAHIRASIQSSAASIKRSRFITTLRKCGHYVSIVYNSTNNVTGDLFVARMIIFEAAEMVVQFVALLQTAPVTDAGLVITTAVVIGLNFVILPVVGLLAFRTQKRKNALKVLLFLKIVFDKVYVTGESRGVGGGGGGGAEIQNGRETDRETTDRVYQN
jgi:hypothetical protein